ncbi:MAG: ABC transporter ATP-binding protein [Rhodospirillaceae bacterium]|jgi:putative spermidine/putrescine transport system ATP-binding protein|nr:ABC transporter ATP-binding protein [Rhodospirillaceae bacterium]MBT3492662.1 ABC transporter ATP-binding protein [Rhodospirillaceae bacterium]MBT3779643.1 ABC transporter ATP-binding protein [Rhodospirillaceae bacterium]MBT3975936.1 ABC transporter ATP-binding protein [Rhodospirillaceae bacterium]MBT4170627.1 ABC transporter ATP-binding protein [Rhodospirillaceae bacterium]
MSQPDVSGSPDAFVEFRSVQKSYDGESLVVKNLNLEIAEGEFLTMLGPSGSGKTTCLMMLAGFEPATNGEIFLRGRPINQVPPHKRGIGMVFQNYALFPHMTVAENLAFPLEVRKIPKADREAKVQRALEMVRLPEFGHRRPAQLSGGQQQRVAVARALVFEPELILMDEPLGALDKNLREEMQYEIKHIHENLGVTVVYVTHDQSEALTMSNRIAVFDDGIIQQLSTPDALYEKPESSFVAQFIGENNRLQGTVKTVNGAICTVQLDSGETVQAAKIKVEDGGSRTTLSIRPERVALNPGPGEVPVILPAKIEELIYLGDHIRARMSVANTDEFIVKVPNDTGRQDLVVGRETTVGWQSEDCRALDEDLARVKVTSKS